MQQLTGPRVAVVLRTTQLIHSENEAGAAPDVICHVMFPYQSNLRSSASNGVVVNGLKHVPKFQCQTDTTSSHVIK